MSASCATGKEGLEPLHQTRRAHPGKGGVLHRLARLAPAPAARRQEAPSAAASASCATARRRERLRRRSSAAANGQDSKVRVREIRAPRSNAGQPSAPLQPRRPNVLWRRDAVRLQALRPRDRGLLPPRDRDRNRLQPQAQRREEVARHREAAAGAKSSGSQPTLPAIEALGRRHCGVSAT